MKDALVRPPVSALTEADARRLLAAGINKPVFDAGPTRFGLAIGCDEKTVRHARDEKSTLRLDLSWNTLIADKHALDPIAAHFGVRLVPINSKCDTDALPTTAAAVHKLALAATNDSPGGTAFTHQELLGMESEIDAALDSLGALKQKIIGLKTGKAA